MSYTTMLSDEDSNSCNPSVWRKLYGKDTTIQKEEYPNNVSKQMLGKASARHITENGNLTNQTILKFQNYYDKTETRLGQDHQRKCLRHNCDEENNFCNPVYTSHLVTPHSNQR